ncbi:MAG: DUF3422 domain-containing protein [Betaproteobacteria bacterium]|nr:DUF3422 domain-containing protein [Betaproteobacteria bacterium]
MRLPDNHPERFQLANEVHARPHEALRAPERASYLAALLEPGERAHEHAHVAALCERHRVHAPPADAIHFAAALGAFRLRWERHTEFSSYAFFVPGRSARPFAEPAVGAVPADWLRAIPGRTVAALHAELLERAAPMPGASEIAATFGGNYVVGSGVGEGAGAAFTDFRIHADGFGRLLVIDRELSRFQAGRTLQRLFEIETYRMMALLALPVARRMAPRLLEMERELAQVAAALAQGGGGDEALLEQLTHLAANVESAIGESRYRFGATRAYHDLVESRIAELRERRLPGTQTIREFMTRRLAPAIATCESAERRLLELSERVARASSLLATRVGVARERQNQELLASMNRRARLQLRLQETVEGLSVAAITYYVVSLVGYAAKALEAAGVRVEPAIAIGVAIPVVAALAALGVRYVRRKIARAELGATPLEM